MAPRGFLKRNESTDPGNYRLASNDSPLHGPISTAQKNNSKMKNYNSPFKRRKFTSSQLRAAGAKSNRLDSVAGIGRIKLLMMGVDCYGQIPTKGESGHS